MSRLERQTQEVKFAMAPATYSQFIRFLQEELALSASSIAFAERICAADSRPREMDPTPLPMVLWQYGFVTLKQLERIFDWMENSPLTTRLNHSVTNQEA